jgi:tetratricopeptide (TPR) repeat protein
MSTPSGQVYEFGGFRMDARKRLLLAHDGQPVQLTPKAFDTLLFLLENRDSVVSKDELMRAIWPRAIVEENNLNQNISAVRRALELDPNNAEGHLGFAHLLSNTGRHAQAIHEVQLARSVNPVFNLAHALEGQFLLNAGRLDEAERVLLGAADLDERFWLTQMYLSNLNYERERFEQSLFHARQAMRFSGGAAQPTALAICALAAVRRKDEARAALDELNERLSRSYVPPFVLALAWSGLGQPDRACEWLQRGIEQRDPRMTFLKVDPRWKPLREHAAFRTVLRQVSLDG